jgi:hypothetical protein
MYISKLTYEIVHMFSTFGKMALLSENLHSHNYGEYTGLQIYILAFIQATSQVYSYKLTYKRVHMFSTFGKMPLLLWSLHSHSYGGYTRL